MLGKNVAEVASIVVENGRYKVVIKNVATDVLLGTVYRWAVAKLGLPSDRTLNLTLAGGNPYVPKYKARYDQNRRTYLGKLKWQGVSLDQSGSLFLSPNANAVSKVKLYQSPDKNAPEVSWYSPIPIDGPLAVRDFYVEGATISGNMNDVSIGFHYTPESGAITYSPSRTLTVYDVQYMMYKKSSYTTPANFASKVAANTFTDNDLEEIGLPVAAPRWLRVGKWENAFSGSTLLANFVNRDPEQFVVRLEGFGSGNPNVSLTLRTEHDWDLFPRLYNLQNPVHQEPHLVNAALPVPKQTWAAYDDSAHSLSFTQRPANSGKFYTAPQMLVSDGQDDARPVSPADNATNDPTHRIAAGGHVAVKPTINGVVQPDFFLEAKVDKAITVNVVVFNRPATPGNPAAPVRSLANVVDEWKAVSERFAQVGVKVHYTIRYGENPVVGISNLVAFVEPFTNAGGGTGVIPIATRAVISNHRDTAADYNVFYIDGLIQQYAGNSNDMASGVAFMTFGLNADNDSFGNSALVSGSHAGLVTAAHELAHLLVNQVAQSPAQPGNALHHSSSLNLLYAWPVHGRDPAASKRLDAYQESRIRQTLGLPAL